jgi:isoquinoline 1-oxidoreductase beta subunit
MTDTSHSIDPGSVGPLQDKFQLSRRAFLEGTTALTLAVGLGSRVVNAAEIAPDAAALAPNGFIRVDAKGVVTVISSYLEMGQGTFTGLATLAAEELDVEVASIRVVPAAADTALYFNPVWVKRGWKVQGTGGSTAMAGAWGQMREAAATARAMLLAAAAQVWNVDAARLKVENGEVFDAGTGRRADYGRFVALAAKLPVPSKVEVKSADAFRVIGDRTVQRLDVPAKVNGTAVYTQDMKLPGMLVAVVAHPARVWAKIGEVDASAALAIPGVVAVVQVPGNNDVQSAVAVLASNTWVARKGRDALKIRWDTEGVPAPDSQQITNSFIKLTQGTGLTAVERGEVLNKAPTGGHLIEAVYEQPYLAHAPMEPMNCLIHLQDDGCDVWNGEQWYTADQAAVAKATGLDSSKVRLHQLYAGGSFGRRANPRADFVQEAARIAAAARKQGVNAPIKMVWMREDDTRGMQYRPLTVHRIRAVLDASGKLVSWHHHVAGQSFTPSNDPKKVDAALLEGVANLAYEVPNLKVEQHNPQDIAVPVQWMRSVGHTHSGFAVETLIDELAALNAQDPLAFRLAMLKPEAREIGVLQRVADMAGWSSPLASGAAGTRRARGIAVRQSFGTYVAQIAEVTVYPDHSFSVDRIFCAVDCGWVINPNNVETQLQSGIGFGLSFLRQAIVLKQGEIQQSNFHDYPVLRMNGMPRVEVAIIESRDPPTGIGEPGVPPTAPAVVNALAAATGIRVRRLPLGDQLTPA